jgi:hypothetical protein
MEILVFTRFEFRLRIGVGSIHSARRLFICSCWKGNTPQSALQASSTSCTIQYPVHLRFTFEYDFVLLNLSLLLSPIHITGI